MIRIIWPWISLQSICLPTHLFPNKTLSPFTNFLPEQVKLKGQWKFANSNFSYPPMYQDFTENQYRFFDERLSKTEPYCLQHTLYSSITDLVETLNTLIEERNTHSDTCIRIKDNRVAQKIEVYLAKEESSLAYCSTILGHIFGGDMRNDLGIPMRRKCLQKPTFAHDIVRTHSLLIYLDIVEFKTVGDTKASLLRCFPFSSKLNFGDIITTGQYVNYPTFSNLQFRRLLKNSFHSTNVDLRDTFVEKFLFGSVGITLLVHLHRKVWDSSRSVSWSGGGWGCRPPCIKMGYSEPRGAESWEGASTRAESREGASTRAESSQVT